LGAGDAGYMTTQTKRTRRTRDQLNTLLVTAQEIIDGEDDQITIRHLFYRLASVGLIDKTENAYKNLCGHLAKWRRTGDIPFSAFADNTRWRFGGGGFTDVRAAVRRCADTYRRDPWANQGVHVEIWTEKDAVASIIGSVADRFGVAVFPCRGFASLSSLHDAAEVFRDAQARGKRTVVHYFGDHDPAGVHIDVSAQATLRDDFDVNVEFVREAVTRDQIEALGLLTRPTKLVRSDGRPDPRAADFVGASVDIDAMPMGELRRLVAQCIAQHIDAHAWAEHERIEAEEKAALERLADEWAA